MTLRDRFADGPQWSILSVLVLVHLTALIAAPFTFSRAGFVALIITYLLTGFGVTVGYHRRLTHRSYTSPRWIDHVLAVLGLLSGEGPPIFWVAQHRQHHAFSETEDDPHTPRDGFWWAHCLWLIPRRNRADLGLLYTRWAPELLKDRFYLFLEMSYLYWHIAFAGILFLIGLSLGGWRTGVSVLVYGVFVRMVLVLHSTWMVNSASHCWGYRNYQTKDSSRNNPIVALVALGEGWHNNHHENQNAANHGHCWWEIDFSFLIILIMALASLPLKRIGLDNWRLARGVRTYFPKGGAAVWFP